jgi:phosphohistidine phosphatase
MKTLVLIRHAKSGKKSHKFRDIDRPLSKKGLKDAPLMGSVLKNMQVTPQLIITSPAVRAMKTAHIIAQEFGFNNGDIISEPGLYLETKSNLLNTIKQTDDKYDTIFVVGHNPGLTDLANFLSEATIENIPTSGIFGIRFNANSWSELEVGIGRMLFFERPKTHRKKNKKKEEPVVH